MRTRCMMCTNSDSTFANTRATTQEFLSSQPYDWKITIADNGSTDETMAVATSLASPRVTALQVAVLAFALTFWLWLSRPVVKAVLRF